MWKNICNCPSQNTANTGMMLLLTHACLHPNPGPLTQLGSFSLCDKAQSHVTMLAGKAAAPSPPTEDS